MTGPEPWRGTEHPDSGGELPFLSHEWDGSEVWEDVEVEESEPDPPDDKGWPENCAGPEYWLYKRDLEDDQCA